VVEVAEWLFVAVHRRDAGGLGSRRHPRRATRRRRPFRGNVTQGIGFTSGGVDLNIAMANRGKRSLAVDLHHEQGKAVLHRLLESADVFLTNFRPGALHRLGLEAETLTAAVSAPGHARGHGYGVRGPDADAGGFDAAAYWARGGLASVLTDPTWNTHGPASGHRGSQRRDGPRVRRPQLRWSSRHAPGRARWWTCRSWPRRC